MPSTAARIPVEERLILALDVPGLSEAKALVEQLDDSVRFYKIGLELAATPHYFPLLEWLLARGKRVFCDLKLYDIPATVAAAVRQISRSGASFLTVHGEPSVMRAAAENKGETLAVLAVTVLTSLSREDLAGAGITMDVEALTLVRAKQAVACGCDGVIASGLEAGRLREQLGSGPLIVAPGIRAESAGSGFRPKLGDDQKRVATAEAALRAGADYVVVGRPIRAAADPAAAARDFQRQIAAAFA